MDFICSLCLFDYTPQDQLSEDELADRKLLTVINGQMVCVSHQGWIQPGPSARMHFISNNRHPEDR